jgi:transcriptional regulator with XRE-family HTH domain
VATISETVGQQIARARARRGWTQQALADALKDCDKDTPLNRAAVAKIESGVRGITLDEVTLIAVALNVPPVRLFLPLEEGEPVTLAASVEVPAWFAYEWFIGREPLPGDASGWAPHTLLVRAYERLLSAQDAAKTAHYRFLSAEQLGWTPDTQIAAYVDALRDLATAMRDFREAGGNPTKLVDRQLAKGLREFKIEPNPRRTVRLAAEEG